jgi:uncharacterized protein (DUF2237 family)
MSSVWPTHERLRPDDREKPAIQLDKEPTIMVREPDATMQPAPQDNQLMSKHRVLRLKSQLRLKCEASTARTKQSRRGLASQDRRCASASRSILAHFCRTGKKRFGKSEVLDTRAQRIRNFGKARGDERACGLSVSNGEVELRAIATPGQRTT